MNRQDNNHNGGARRSRDGRDERQPARGKGRKASPLRQPARPREAGAGAGETRGPRPASLARPAHRPPAGQGHAVRASGRCRGQPLFPREPQLGHRERGIIAEAVFAVLRRRVEFAQFAESGSGAAARRLALLGLAATQGRDALTSLLSPEEAEWLDRLTTIERASLAPRVRANLPEWLFDELVKHHGEAFTAALADAWLRPAPLDLRVNTLKGSREDALAELAAAGLRAEPTPMAPAGIRLSGKPALNSCRCSSTAWSKCRMRAASCCASCWRRAAARWWWTSAPAPVARRWPWAPRCVPPAGSTPSTCRRSAWPT